MNDAAYRKHNDHSHNSSKYHKKDGTNVRAILKQKLRKDIEEGLSPFLDKPITAWTKEDLRQAMQQHLKNNFPAVELGDMKMIVEVDSQDLKKMVIKPTDFYTFLLMRGIVIHPQAAKEMTEYIDEDGTKYTMTLEGAFHMQNEDGIPTKRYGL